MVSCWQAGGVADDSQQGCRVHEIFNRARDCSESDGCWVGQWQCTSQRNPGEVQEKYTKYWGKLCQPGGQAWKT